MGRLWQLASGASTTRFIYDGDALIWENNGAGTLLNAYVHGPNAAADDPLIWYDGNAGFLRRFLHTDHQGSIIAAADDLGAMVAINAYDPWGIPNAANVGRFQYTGQAWLGELGMYYYKARIYSPTLGRFMQTDPVGYEGGINLYAYVGDDPVNRGDFGGLAPQDFQFLHDTKITVNIDDSLSSTDQATAVQALTEASGLTRSMESSGALPSDAAAAIRAHGTMSVSPTRMSGYSPETHNFNLNMSELSTNVQRQGAYRTPAELRQKSLATSCTMERMRSRMLTDNYQEIPSPTIQKRRGAPRRRFRPLTE